MKVFKVRCGLSKVRTFASIVRQKKLVNKSIPATYKHLLGKSALVAVLKQL